MYYNRKIVKDIKKYMDSDLILLIIWWRQVGKTTILKEIKNNISKKEDSYFLNLENFDIKKQLDIHPENIFKITWASKNKKHIIFIDEIQYLENPTNFLKYIYDEYKWIIKLIVTWSSAFYIDKKFKDSLIWRKKIFNMYWLDFIEYLWFQWRDDLAKIFDTNKKIPLLFKKDIEILWLEYITYWWYPQIVLLKLKEQKIDRLNDYCNDYIKKDIYESKIQDEIKFFNLIKILASQTWNLLNINELANSLDSSQPTIEKFIYILQKTFHISLIKPFFNNLRKELSKMPKIYFNDLWIRNSFLRNFENIHERIDKWQYLENIIFREFLFKHQLDYIKFRRTQSKNEVDFIIEDKNAYEIKFDKKNLQENKYKIFKEQYNNIPLKFIWFDDVLEMMYVRD